MRTKFWFWDFDSGLLELEKVGDKGVMLKPASGIGAPLLEAVLSMKERFELDDREDGSNVSMEFEYVASRVQLSTVEDVELGHMPPYIYIPDVELSELGKATADAR